MAAEVFKKRSVQLRFEEAVWVAEKVYLKSKEEYRIVVNKKLRYEVWIKQEVQK